MPSPTERTKRPLSAVLLSIALHGSLFAFLFLLGTAARTRRIDPTRLQVLAQLEVAGGAHAVRIPLPVMDSAAHTRQPTPDPEASKKTILPVEQPHPKVAGGGAPPTLHKGDGSGQAQRGNGSDADEIHPGFPIFSPRPPVSDRALLPATERKIIVDVNVDALGQVTDEHLMQGLGNRLDQIVLDTVKSWRFQPETVNGKPVASEAELIFPFNLQYPLTEG
jgi:TonB family protein